MFIKVVIKFNYQNLHWKILRRLLGMKVMEENRVQ